MFDDEAFLLEDLYELADRSASEARRYVTTLSEVASGSEPAVALPMLMLAVTEIAGMGARLGAIGDIVPSARFEPDVGPDVDFDPLLTSLRNALDGVDEYADIVDPLFSTEPDAGSLSADLAFIASNLAQGLRHFDAGQRGEAMWWWQYSFLSAWGERAASALRVLVALLAHARLDVSDELVAEAEFDALHP